MRRSFNFIGLLFMICASCGSKNNGQPQETKVNIDTLKAFTLPTVPLMLNTPEARSKYLSKHYWDRMNFTDTNYVHHPEITEQAWVNYIDLLKIVPDTLAKLSVKELFNKAEANKKIYLYFTGMADKYLYDPNSPFRNEELYIPVLDNMIHSTVLSSAEKIRPAERRKLAERNRKGKRAIDFNYTLASGKSGTLYGIKSEYTLLFINNPGCHACEETIQGLKQAPAINKKINEGRLTILSVYPDEEMGEWQKHLADFPAKWINSYDKKQVIRNKNIYDLKAIPTLYLLDSKKTVLLKDATVIAIDQYLSR